MDVEKERREKEDREERQEERERKRDREYIERGKREDSKTDMRGQR